MKTGMKIGAILGIFLILAVAKQAVSWAKDASPSATPTPTGTEESVTEEIKQKVQERLSKASRQKKAFVGTLSDIADATLKINTDQGVKMAATNEKTVLLRNEGGVQTKVKINELPLQQQVIAMGYLENGNGGNGGVLSATRVISQVIPTQDTRLVKSGTVANLTKKGDFTLSGMSGESYTIKVSQKTGYSAVSGDKVIDYKKSLSEGMRVIVAGVPDKKDETIINVSLVYITSKIEEVKATPTPSPKKTSVSPTPTVSQ